MYRIRDMLVAQVALCHLFEINVRDSKSWIVLHYVMVLQRILNCMAIGNGDA